jgi:hypothetical protein
LSFAINFPQKLLFPLVIYIYWAKNISSRHSKSIKKKLSAPERSELDVQPIHLNLSPHKYKLRFLLFQIIRCKGFPTVFLSKKEGNGQYNILKFLFMSYTRFQTKQVLQRLITVYRSD